MNVAGMDEREAGRRKQRGDAEEEHGDEAQSGPVVAVAAAWFTL